ncbi:hypothetical protein ABPG75_011087 [Micractinium tetrahymenae]
MSTQRVSDPDPATCELAARIYAAGMRHCGIPLQDCLSFPETKYRSPDELADAIISIGCRELQAIDMHEHGNRLGKGSLGSQAQSVMERLHQEPEPRAAQLVRQRVQAEWMQGDERLNKLADRVLAIGLAEEAAAPVPDSPEAAAQRVLDVARRRLAAAEGNHITAGGAAAEVDAAFDTFDPPIRRHALADIVLRRLQRASGARKPAQLDPVPEGAMEAEA